MKNFYVLVVLAIMLPLSVFAIPAGKSLTEVDGPVSNYNFNGIGIKSSDVISVKQDDAPAPQMAFKLLQDNVEYFWSHLFEGLTPFTYEQKSNTLIFVSTERAVVDDWSDCFVYLHFSNDGGQNWTKAEVWRAKKMMAFFPSVAVLNPNNATDPSQFKYVITFTPFEPVPTPNDTLYYGNGNMYLFMNGSGFGPENITDYKEAAPVTNNAGGNQEWGVSQKNTFAVSSSKGDHFYVYGSLSNKDGYQYGNYGLAYMDFSEDLPDPLSQIPMEWMPNQFRTPEGLSSTYNAPMRMGADEEGNVYSFVFNMFNDDQDNRIPAFSKSTDNGKTWSTFSRMPFSVISDFLSNWDHNMQFNYVVYPYTAWPAVVTGVDEFSVFLRLWSFVGQTAETAVGTGHYVEAQYKNGTWQPLRRIGELIDPRPIRIANAASPQFKDSIMANPRYHEFEAAKTADGSALVVKYLDAPAENNIAALQTPVNLYNNPMGLVDSVIISDIFVAYRNTNENNWNPAFNITQDVWYNKGTYMPQVVPSISQIPIAEHVTQQLTNAENIRYNYPYFLQNIVADRATSGFTSGTAYSVYVSVFDAANPQVVRNPTVQIAKGIIGVSVNENLPFALNDISPNPAAELAVINFTLEMDADVNVTLHNSMGQVVKSFFAPNSQAGLNTINVVTNDLPSGAYFYTINVNGKTQTKLLNVIR
jgi:hypothetical protein